jgi:hypothetical protein
MGVECTVGTRCIRQDAARAAIIGSRRLERVDGVLRQWPVAGLSLLVLAIAFGAALLR